ncbi:MAG: hypothetical protein IJ849_12160 [Selenomonadaceae bacterium]|nr:hypothetical protein [Selenomonadaceae bacterium]
MKIDGVEVTIEGLEGVTVEELEYYLDYAKANTYGNLLELKIKPDEQDKGKVVLEYAIQTKFERIRRITGYLVGTIDRWNNAKRQEERDRVKHG